MKKICYSALLTAVVVLVGLKIADRQHALLPGEKDREGFSVGEFEEPVFTASQEATQFGGQSRNWRTVVAGKETGKISLDAVPEADPVGAFQRWAREFVEGTADLEEGLRLAKARRTKMARLIRENPRQAIANRIDDDIREALPESIRDQLEQPTPVSYTHLTLPTKRIV